MFFPTTIIADHLILFGHDFGMAAKDVTFEAVLGFVMDIASNLIGLGALVAVLFIIISGLKLIYSGGNQEQATKAKNSLMWAIIGFVVTLTAYIIVTTFLEKFTGIKVDDIK